MPPFASYCLATFKRPEYLRTTLDSITSQTEADFEIIVSDNDPRASARAIVDSRYDRRIKYSFNEENIGMVGNFNKALSRATGSYVVMITDDDPIYPSHLLTLRQAARRYPGFGAYFAAGDICHENQFVATCNNSAMGVSRPHLDNRLRPYEGPAFFDAFFKGRIPFYMLWSCGMVRRDIAQEITMPDYGSPFLTDFAYITLTGTKAGAVLIHTALGRQNVHGANFGRHEFAQLPIAINGFLALFPSSQYPPRARGDIIHFLTRWTAGHIWFLRRFFRADPAMLQQVDDCVAELSQNTPLTSLRYELSVFSVKQSLSTVARLVRDMIGNSRVSP